MNERFASNLQRVRNIVLQYEEAAGASQGRPSVQEGDLLRAAVVFLHATLEDLLRTLAEDRLPQARAEVLKQLPWPRGGTAVRAQFDLGDLEPFRGQSVADVIRHAIIAYLERSNFNHPGEIKRILDWIEIDPTIVDAYAGELGVMIARRHWIVHCADRNEAVGRGHHVVRSISKSLVLRWLNAVERFGNDVLNAAS